MSEKPTQLDLPLADMPARFSHQAQPTIDKESGADAQPSVIAGKN
jgi:hypothetical protein